MYHIYIIMRFLKVRDVKTPVRGTDFSAGIDFFVPNDFNNGKPFELKPQHDLLIPSGIKVNVPNTHMLMAADKSGVVTSKEACLAANRKPKANAFDSIVIIGAKIVDEDYKGEMYIHLINVGNNSVMIEPGMKITQFIAVPVSYVDLEEVSSEEALFEDKHSTRGDNGFGFGTGCD